MVKCLGPHTFTTVGVGLIPAWGTNILQALWRSQKNKIKISLPDSPGEHGMQPRDPCLPWRGKLGPGHTLR